MMSEEGLIEVESLEDIKVGTRVHVSYSDDRGLRETSWVGTHPLVTGTIVNESGARLVMLDRCNVFGAWALNDGFEVEKEIDPKYLTNVRPTDRRFWWISGAKAVKLIDPKYLSPVSAVGVWTCKCGAMNVDPSVSAIVNGKYVCYGCRVLFA